VSVYHLLFSVAVFAFVFWLTNFTLRKIAIALSPLFEKHLAIYRAGQTVRWIDANAVNPECSKRLTVFIFNQPYQITARTLEELLISTRVLAESRRNPS
jgi:hypothetical protein